MVRLVPLVRCLGAGSCPAVLLAPVDHLTRICDSVRPVSSQVQGHPPHSSEGSRCPCLVRGITVLLAKDVMEPVPPAEMKAEFFSPYIIVPKKSGGLRPILGLRILNWAFHKPPFKMLMQNRIFGCIRPRVWSAAFDLKDPYFHVSILPRHRPFLRFAFEGRAYQYKVLPFGSLLADAEDLFSQYGVGFGRSDSASHAGTRSVGVELLEYVQEQQGGPTESVSEAPGAYGAAVTPLGLLHMTPPQHWPHG